MNDGGIIEWGKSKEKVEEEGRIWGVEGGLLGLKYEYGGKYVVEVKGGYEGC